MGKLRKLAAGVGLATILMTGASAQQKHERFSASFGVGPFETTAQPTPAINKALLDQLPPELDYFPELKQEIIDSLPKFSNLGLTGKKYNYNVGYTTERFKVQFAGNVIRSSHLSDGKEFGEKKGNEIAGDGGDSHEVTISKAFGQSKVKPDVSFGYLRDHVEYGSPYVLAKDVNNRFLATGGAHIGRYDDAFLRGFAGLGLERLSMDRALPTAEEMDTSKAPNSPSSSKRGTLVLGAEGRAYLGRHLELPGSVSYHQPFAASSSGLPLRNSGSFHYSINPTFWVNPGSRAVFGLGARVQGAIGEDKLTLSDGSTSPVRGVNKTPSWGLEVKFKLQR